MKLVVFGTVSEQARGLQYMDHIDPDTVFLFPAIREGRPFHTRNVQQPIDIAFVGQDTKVISVLTADPGKDDIRAPKGTAAALESVAGLMTKIGIVEGSSFAP